MSLNPQAEAKKLEDAATYLSLPSTKAELEEKGHSATGRSMQSLGSCTISKDSFQVSTLVCSTKLTQNGECGVAHGHPGSSSRDPTLSVPAGERRRLLWVRERVGARACGCASASCTALLCNGPCGCGWTGRGGDIVGLLKFMLILSEAFTLKRQKAMNLLFKRVLAKERWEILKIWSQTEALGWDPHAVLALGPLNLLFLLWALGTDAVSSPPSVGSGACHG